MPLSKISLVIVVLIIAFGAWLLFSKPVGNGAETPGESERSGASSEASLDADLSAIDAQLQGLEQDATAVDASFADTPVEQTE
jgi:hypothetical protein